MSVLEPWFPDVVFIKVLAVLFGEDLWRSELKSFPPVLFGVGPGLCDASPHLGFFVKGRLVAAEYINSLTIEK